MLAVQIAAGIVLAAIVLRFWRQSLWVGLGLLVVVLLLLLVMWGTATPGRKDVLVNAGMVALIVSIVGLLRLRAARRASAPTRHR